VAQDPIADARAFLEFAVDLAEQAGRFVRPHYQSALDVELKADRSPVTVADRGAERLIREAIANRFPTHAIVGEEFGDDRRDASHRWFVDPIDGTRSFVHGVPLFGVLLGLQIDGEMLVGVCHLPALGDTIAAARGCGCTWNGRPARVTRTSTLTEATIVYSDSRLLARRLGARWDALSGHLPAPGGATVMALPGRHRARRCDARSVMNPGMCAALVPILQESGGRFTDWQGRPASTAVTP
jgi:fructose-1,6-bisphosphatase/inositol monophosphatase family enzyme